jgi:ABC-2 type transport system ATP-binding protein
MLRCEGLTKRYEEIVALDGLDLAIPRGHVFGYIGHNGAGKTTTIRILAGLLRPSDGRAWIAGQEVTDRPGSVKPLVGYMPDAFGVYDRMRVWEYLDFFGAAFRIPRRQRRERVDRVLEITGSEPLRDRFVDTLSKGMKQRVGIARTLLHDPEVLLLDEPASGLDPQARVEMRELLGKLADAGKTLLVSSHILPELAAICDSIGILHKGRLKAAGGIDEVLSQLQRDRLMELKTLGAGEQSLSILQARPDVYRPERSGEVPGVVRFRFRGDDDALATMTGELHDAGVRLVTCREVPLSLEDAYMSISGLGSDVPGGDEPPAANEAEGTA